MIMRGALAFLALAVMAQASLANRHDANIAPLFPYGFSLTY
jgi:hypothetical protein